MNKADSIVERGATFLEGLARKAAGEGGFAAKLAEPLGDDADFLRKLKPSLVALRLRGDETPAEPPASQPELRAPPVPAAPAPQRPSKGPSPWLVVGGALAVGILVARIVDWRAEAHPKD